MKHIYAVCMVLLLVMSTGCQRSTDDIWNDTKTARRHVGRGVDTLGGKRGNSRQVTDESEFFGARKPSRGEQKDFIPLEDDEDLLVGDSEAIPAPMESPGDEGSSIPGIDAFKDPSQDPELAAVFEHVHFPYNSSLVKGDDDLRIIRNVTSYLQKHPRMCIFVEGHCDKRGSAAYNFALGANRANAVRSALVREGLSPNRVFTISYGKERLLFEEDGEEYHRLNRRGQFKLYEK